MMLSDRIGTIIWAFDSRDSRRDEIREIVAQAVRLEAAIESAKCLAEVVGEVDEDIQFVPMPMAMLSDADRESIVADGRLHKCWHDFQDAIGEVES